MDLDTEFQSGQQSPTIAESPVSDSHTLDFDMCSLSVKSDTPKPMKTQTKGLYGRIKDIVDPYVKKIYPLESLRLTLEVAEEKQTPPPMIKVSFSSILGEFEEEFKSDTKLLSDEFRLKLVDPYKNIVTKVIAKAQSEFFERVKSLQDSLDDQEEKKQVKKYLTKLLEEQKDLLRKDREEMLSGTYRLKNKMRIGSGPKNKSKQRPNTAPKKKFKKSTTN